MTDDDFLVSQPVPGSGASILIGRLPDGARLPGGAGQRVLWIVDVPGMARAKPPGAVTVLPAVAGARLEEGIEEFLNQSPKYLPSLFVTRWLPAEHAAGYAAAIDTVSACLESSRRARLTRQQDAFAWQSHLLANLSDYVARRLPSVWEGALAGLPAFICGAGPSLDASLDALTRVAGKGVIFAADSSLRKLATRGLRADFADSVDVAKTPANCLPDAAIQPDRVILSALSPPDWANAVSADRRHFLASTQLTLDWLDSLGVTRTGIMARENCGATALEVARFFGCAPICLFGMDLALDATGPVRRHHDGADEAAYTESGFNPAQAFPEVPGNFSETVPTHVLGDWRTLDRRLAGWPPGLVWVVTDRGARLANTTVCLPDGFDLPPTARSKEAALAALAAASPAAAPPVVAEKLVRFGGRLLEWTPTLRRVYQADGAAALAEHLRSLFAEPEHGLMLGAFALKLMPHLLPPVDESSTDWGGLIDELEKLGRQMGRSAAALG